ncbi:hypothetical protein OCAE111667_10155 [Occultella aeris]|uniref:Uncharacterized protein n=1 Tax=Occultella aeris TaxID=2761496 RepID=A0A7M4DNH9_9MICO|nr:hypothetical protein [Occultella aeris]VZO38992.1 hypothetical protein HALOF300_03709 [Occultella aeris]
MFDNAYAAIAATRMGGPIQEDFARLNRRRRPRTGTRNSTTRPRPTDNL